jgi:hypothetical protein
MRELNTHLVSTSSRFIPFAITFVVSSDPFRTIDAATTDLLMKLPQSKAFSAAMTTIPMGIPYQPRRSSLTSTFDLSDYVQYRR